MKNRLRMCLLVSCAIIVIAVVMLISNIGVNGGIDYQDGALIKLRMGKAFEVSDVERALDSVYTDAARVDKAGSSLTDALVHVNTTDGLDTLGASLESALRDKYPGVSVASVARLGATVSTGAIVNAVIAVLVSLVLVFIYVTVRFELAYGIAATVSALHDVLLTIAVMVILSSFVKQGSSFVVVCVAVAVWSVRSTLVVFDRIRENMKTRAKLGSREEVAVRSIKESRNAQTLTTLILALAFCVLFIIGAGDARAFALSMIVGLLACIYSSSFISGYMWCTLAERVKSVNATTTAKNNAGKPGKKA